MVPSHCDSVIFQQPWRWLSTLSIFVTWQERSPIHRDAWGFIHITHILARAGILRAGYTPNWLGWHSEIPCEYLNLSQTLLISEAGFWCFRSLEICEFLFSTYYWVLLMSLAVFCMLKTGKWISLTLCQKMIYWLSKVAMGAMEEKNVQGDCQVGPDFIFRPEKLSWGGSI